MITQSNKQIITHKPMVKMTKDNNKIDNKININNKTDNKTREELKLIKRTFKLPYLQATKKLRSNNQIT